MTDSPEKTTLDSFFKWLVRQSNRKDSVGRLAIYAAANPEWPREATYFDTIGYLVEARLAKLVPALHRAWLQYREAVERG
jgi:uncharacterized protein YozE (UPF0346 family)